jgi:CyaY protein
MRVTIHGLQVSVKFKVMIDETTFRRAADAALESLFKSLTRAGDSYAFDADMNNGALTVEFEDPPAKFVVSPNAPVRQIWVSAHSRSFKLDWNETAGSFVLGDSGQTLAGLMGEHIGQQLGEEVAL